MTLVKKNTISSTIVVSSSVYTCTKCDHTEIFKNGDDIDSERKCPQCEAEMKLISATTGEEKEETEIEETEE